MVSIGHTISIGYDHCIFGSGLSQGFGGFGHFSKEITMFIVVEFGCGGQAVVPRTFGPFNTVPEAHQFARRRFKGRDLADSLDVYRRGCTVDDELVYQVSSLISAEKILA